jgi:hypothetical protein
LPAGSIEREHQLTTQPLAERSLGDERLELGDEIGSSAPLELRVDEILAGGEAQLLQPAGLD